jgi:plasmid stabilization system protein ParE
MKYSIEWTKSAETDLENILHYYLQEVWFEFASKIFTRIKTQIDLLETLPERCRIWRVEGTREYVLSKLPYIAVICVEEGRVIILNIIHTRRLYPL